MKINIGNAIAAFSFVIILQACSATRYHKTNVATSQPEVNQNAAHPDNSTIHVTIDTKNVDPDSVIAFAETLIGTRYKYGSAIKENGFDCSGFISYVFNHFNIKVPRVSRDFRNAGYPVQIESSRPGDLILFTGTDTTGWVVGHMGIITRNYNGKVQFIHSSSGKSIGVINSGLSKYYATRFVKVIRIFNFQAK